MALFDFLTKGAPTARRPLSEREALECYPNPDPSFIALMPFVEYEPASQCFLFEDGYSVGTVMEIAPVDMNIKTAEQYYELQTAIYNALTVIPTRRENPWVVQVFLSDEPLHDVVTDLYHYAKADCRDSAYSQHFFAVMKEHFEIVSSPGGLFIDSLTGKPWKGKLRRVRLCLYRFIDPKEAGQKHFTAPDKELEEVRKRLILALKKAGVGVKIYAGKDLYAWLLPWFSPQVDGMSAWELMHKSPYPEQQELDGTLGADFDLAQLCVKNAPISDKNHGTWQFANSVQRFVSLQSVQIPPHVGLLTIGKADNDFAVALFDDLPEGSTYAMSIVFESQADIGRHILKVSKASGGGSGLAERAKAQAIDALDLVDAGNLMFRMAHGIYLRAESQEKLDVITNEVIASVRGTFDAIEPKDDSTAIDSYRHNLPMCYQPAHAKRAMRARLTYAQHIARLIPVYGHARGSGNFGLLYFNRIGELLAFDPLSKKDRTKTAHALLFGPTGAGKSATMNYNQMFKMAMRNPRMFIIEAGNSFGLLAEEFKRYGKTVNHIRFKKTSNVSIPPFANAIRALEEEEKLLRMLDADFDPLAHADEPDDDEERDYLGEMLQSAILMVSNADKHQAERITPQDRRALTMAILQAARNVRARDAHLPQEQVQVIISDVAQAMREQLDDSNEIIKSLTDTRRDRITELADSLDNFTTGLRNKFFNQKGEAWPEADVTIVDMADLAKEMNKDMLAVALISLINRISDLGEKYQADDREIDANTDEGHVITTNPTIAPPVVYGVKTWRKLGIWLTQATQNLADYPDESEKMLNLAEWWILLNVDIGDLSEMKRFKDLSPEQESLIKSCTKEIPNFTEGVVLSNKLTARFRVVQPALALTLAMTESDEKALRQNLMREHNLPSELDAAYYLADEINQRRRQNAADLLRD